MRSKVVSAFHNVSSDVLQDLESDIDCDVIVCGNADGKAVIKELLVHLKGSRYIDGGYRRSSENADLAAGYGRVLVLSPLGGRSRAPLDWGMHLAAQVDELRARGSRVETILPDSNSRDAFGSNLMDLSTRPPAARAGYDQGRALAEQLTEFWR